MERFEFQLSMLQKGAEELEKKIAAFTTILLQIKTAAITIWTAIIGWSFTIKVDLLILVGYVIVIGFWLLESIYWRVQFYYMARATELTEYLNNQEALDESFRDKKIPQGLVYPLGSSKKRQHIPLLKAIKAPSIFTFYVFLIIVTSILLLITIKT